MRGTTSHPPSFHVAGVAQTHIHRCFAWQAWHSWHWVARLDWLGRPWRPWRRGTLRGRRGTTSHPPSFCVAGVAQTHIYRRFAWQAWHRWHWVARLDWLGRPWRPWRRGILRGRRGTTSHPPSFCVAGVAQSHIHHRFPWQAWHLWHWVARLDWLGRPWRPWRRGTLRGRRGTWWHPPSFHVAGVALGDIHLRFAWQAWHFGHWAGSGGALGLDWLPVTPRHFAWQAWHLATFTFVYRGRRGTWWHPPLFRVAGMVLGDIMWHPPSFCVAGVALGDMHLRFVTHHLLHTIFDTPSLTHHLSHHFVTHHLSHTVTDHLSHTIFHTPLCLTPSFTTPSFTHHFVTHHLSHTIFRQTIFHTPSFTTPYFPHQLCHTPSFTHHLCHTPSFTHLFVTPHLSYTIFHTSHCHTPSFTHHLSHTTLSHTIFDTPLCHTPLCHTPSFTHHLPHHFVTYHLSHTVTDHLSHTIFHTTLCLTPSFTTPSFTHHFVTHHLSPHHLSHTTLSHTIFHHTIFNTQLCHTPSFAKPSFTHHFVTHHISHTTLSHALFHTQLSHTPSFTHHFVTHTFFLSHTPAFTYNFVTHNFVLLLDPAPPPLSFLPSSSPLQHLVLIIERSCLVGLSGPLIIDARNLHDFSLEICDWKNQTSNRIIWQYGSESVNQNPVTLHLGLANQRTEHLIDPGLAADLVPRKFRGLSFSSLNLSWGMPHLEAIPFSDLWANHLMVYLYHLLMINSLLQAIIWGFICPVLTHPHITLLFAYPINIHTIVIIPCRPIFLNG